MARGKIRHHAVLCSLACAAACGRGGFDPLDPPDPADGPIAGLCPPASQCTLGDWSVAAVQPFENVTSRPPNEQTEWTGEISCDGLQLVYSTAHGVDDDRIYLATRERLEDPFDAPILQDVQIRMHVHDPSLRYDGLEIYFVSDSSPPCIYSARRDERSTPSWRAPSRILDCAGEGQRLGGPALSHDGMRLYYHRADVGGGTLAMMMATRESLEVEFDMPGAQVMWTPASGMVKGGYCAVTSDELTIYCEDGNPAYVVESTRASLDQPFGAAIPVRGLPRQDAMGRPISTGDPSITSNGQLLVYASTVDGSDPRNGFRHLRLAERSCQAASAISSAAMR